MVVVMLLQLCVQGKLVGVTFGNLVVMIFVKTMDHMIDAAAFHKQNVNKSMERASAVSVVVASLS